MSDTERALQVQRRGLFWAVSSGAYRDSLELLLRNKVDRKEQTPVFWKKAGKAQSVSTFCMGHRADRFDWYRESIP